ncbi:MAG: leucine-rich repeat domain-containing protein [Clostridia bacterium]|nr:leucine-rich repeat domain-containing protein [Clostridia bacterium]
MNKKSLFLKLTIIVLVISSAFILSSCFTATLSIASCQKNCQESCRNNSDNYDGNEYGIYYTLSDDGQSYFVSEVGYKETSVIIPETYEGKPVTGIRRGAFTHIEFGVGCAGPRYFGNNFTSLTLPKTLKTVEDGVFGYGISEYGYYNDCGRCDAIYFEGTLEDWFSIKFGSSPFSNETELYIGGKKVTDVEIPESITSIGENVFACYGWLKSVTFHEKVALINEYAFYGCDKLEELIFPCADLTVERAAFKNCSGIETITFTGEKLVLGYEAFAYCARLKEVNWNTVSITTIPQFAFCECSGLETFVIPSSVEVIRDGAFAGCYNLVEIYNLSKLNVVAGASTHGGVAYFAGAVHTSEEEKSSILTVGDYKFTVSETENVLFKYTGEGGALNLPVLESGEEYRINNSVFRYDDRILSVNVPDCVTAIGENAFFECTNLKIVSGCKGLLTVGNKAFAGCINLESVELVKVEEIGNFAFSGCAALNAVALPQSVNKIGTAAFDGTANLTYAGTLEEWLEVELSKDASKAVKITCSDGEIWEGEI